VPAREEVCGAGIFLLVGSFFEAALIEKEAKQGVFQTVAA
jgi:hypothetical protein